jgi:hypothetical protein
MEAADNLTDAQVKFSKVWLILGVHEKGFPFPSRFFAECLEKVFSKVLIVERVNIEPRIFV